MNNCLLSGRLTHDPAYTVRNGLAICRLKLRVDRQKKREGRVEAVPFEVEVSVFGASAEHTSNAVLRGSRITVRGRLDPYQAANGALRVALVADELEWETLA